ALLTARLTYAKTANPIDAVDLKTLAQFILLGDPSAHPVTVAGGRPKAKAIVNLQKTIQAESAPTASRDARRERREQSRTVAERVEATAPVANQRSEIPAEIAALLKEHSEKQGITTTSTMSMSAGAVPRTAMAGAKSKAL